MTTQANPVTRPDEALLVFLGPEAPASLSLTLYDISEPAIQFIGIVQSGRKVAYAVKPGKHIFMLLATSTDFLEANVEAGKSYYAVTTMQPSARAFGMAVYSLMPVRRAELSSSEFLRLVGGYAYVVRTARADAWYASNSASVYARRDKFLPQWSARSPKDRAARTLQVTDGQ